MEISGKLGDLFQSTDYLETSWDTAKTLFMLNAIELRYPLIDSNGSRRKNVWQNVSAEMTLNGYPISSGECNKKWRNLKVDPNS